ncbi:MAG: ParA family protein [Saprospiraceae bacterium]
MSKIIVFGNQKGGVGKTTCTVLTAAALSRPPFNLKVTVIDTDHQKSIVKSRLLDMEEFDGVIPFDVLNYNAQTLQNKIRDLDKDNDVVFIDVAGKLDSNVAPEQQEISRVLMYADYLFLPFTSGNYTLDATLDYLQFVLKVREQRADSARPLQIVGFINMYRERSRNNRYLIGEINQIKHFAQVPFMDHKLGLYTVFSDVDTVNSLYEPETKDNGLISFYLWVNEFMEIITGE